MKWQKLFFLLALGLNQCVPASSPSSPFKEFDVTLTARSSHSGGPAIPFITDSDAERFGYLAEDTRVDIEPQGDATKQLKAALKVARSNGSVAVGEVVVVRPRGDSQECRSLITAERETVAHTVPGTETQVSVPGVVTERVTENEFRCTTQSRPHTETQYTQHQEYDSFSKQSRTVTQSRQVTVYRSEQECRSNRVEKDVRRIESHLESKITPPSLEYVAQQRLKQSDPVCHETATPPGSRLELRLYRRAPRPSPDKLGPPRSSAPPFLSLLGPPCVARITHFGLLPKNPRAGPCQRAISLTNREIASSVAAG